MNKLIKPRLKIKQVSAAILSTGKVFDIYRVYKPNQKYFDGFAIDSDTFKKRSTVNEYIGYLQSIGCDFTANNIIDILDIKKG